jgi:hypothetical protein
MRDIVAHIMYGPPNALSRVLDDPTNPARQEYLSRFADEEGGVFVDRFSGNTPRSPPIPSSRTWCPGGGPGRQPSPPAGGLPLALPDQPYERPGHPDPEHPGDGGFLRDPSNVAASGLPLRQRRASLGSAIGSSGDRPAALAELVGILLNDGVRPPTVLMEDLHFAVGTPYEVSLQRMPAAGDPAVYAAAPRAARARPAGSRTGVGTGAGNTFSPGAPLGRFADVYV